GVRSDRGRSEQQGDRGAPPPRHQYGEGTRSQHLGETRPSHAPANRCVRAERRRPWTGIAVAHPSDPNESILLQSVRSVAARSLSATFGKQCRGRGESTEELRGSLARRCVMKKLDLTT